MHSPVGYMRGGHRPLGAWLRVSLPGSWPHLMVSSSFLVPAPWGGVPMTLEVLW
jgi:hypothetical protein